MAIKKNLNLLAQSIPEEAFNMSLSSYMEASTRMNERQASHIRQALENVTREVETTRTTIRKASKMQTSRTISTAGLKPSAMFFTSIIVAVSAIITLSLLIKRRKEKLLNGQLIILLNGFLDLR